MNDRVREEAVRIVREIEEAGSIATADKVDIAAVRITAIAQPLVAALREALDVGDGSWLVNNGDDSWIKSRDKWLVVLGEWG